MIRLVLGVVVLAWTLVAAPSAAEGLHFDGDRLLHDHTFLQLTAAQRRAIRESPNEEFDGHFYKSVRLQLTDQQRRAIRRATGENIRWLTARDRVIYELDCVCGDVNIAIIYPKGRIAVLHDFLDEKARR